MYTTTVLLIVFIFGVLGFSLGWVWCDKKTTDEFIDHVSKLNLMTGYYVVTKGEDNEEQPLI